jgi:cytochrome c-type biogenesis protein CcmH/NrfG
MKYLFAVALLYVSALPCSAQQLTYSEWQKEVQSDVRLLPKYGGIAKTAEQLESDSIFIKTALKELENPRKASDYMVKLGFDFLAKGDPKQASYRFNQAWLLDPKNENVFWGFGGIYFLFNDHEKALEQYTEGLVLNPKSAPIMTDMAAIGMARYQTNKVESELTASINLLKLAYEIDPTYQTMLAKLAICYYLTNDCTNAIKYHDECKKLGGKTLSESFTKALQEKCKN